MFTVNVKATEGDTLIHIQHVQKFGYFLQLVDAKTSNVLELRMAGLR